MVRSRAGCEQSRGRATTSHRLHGGVTKVVYTSLSASLRATARGLRVAGDAGVGAEIEATSRGRFVRAAVNGLIGDRLRDEGSRFAFDMGVRVNGRDVVLDREGVAAAFPDATDRLVVFVHGLSENEAYWNRAARPRTDARREHPDRRSYGDRLLEDGWTPVYLRVNTGLPIAENGFAMAALLGPARGRVARRRTPDRARGPLHGRSDHASGVCRCHRQCSVTWIRALDRPGHRRRLPRHPAPRCAAGAGGQQGREPRWGRLPEAAPFGRILEYRSVGILDLAPRSRSVTCRTCPTRATASSPRP